jgi:Ca-activated chloride channel family protein
MIRTAVALLTGLALLGGQDRAQFRGGTDLVSVYATVIDRNRRLVPDLRQQDFVVTDNGRPQTLSFFTNEVQPFSVVLMLDRSGSMNDHVDLPRDAAVEFVRHMLPADQARIGNFSDAIRITPPEFTSDQGRLISVLQQDLQTSGASPVWTAIDRSIDALVPMPGRRVVLVLTDGHDEPVWNQPRTKLTDLVDRARTADVMIYTIGFSASTSQYHTSPASRPRGPFGFPPGGPAARNTSLLTKVIQPPDPALKDLAEISGGGYFELKENDDLRETFRRVAEELHRQYWMGFTPARLDGKEHEIEVTVKRRGLDVRARKHYIAGAGTGR